MENPQLKQVFDSELPASQRLVKPFFAPSASSRAAGEAFTARLAQRNHDREPVSGPEVAKGQIAAFRSWEAFSWTAYLKDRQPKTLMVWGRNDPLILPAAAEFVKQVVPTADLCYFDGGHFVLDEYADAIAEAIIETFSPIAGMSIQ